ncbi:MAG: DUF2851 family protein [Bacteroidales bacterium]|nr:DUF2851 family protein [Bacteroidales bacterium]
MNEEFLYYLWKFRLFKQDIKTCSGEGIKIISPGTQNLDSGPDFFNARISIGDTFWAGNVEIHINASDWFRHGHDNDPSYDNIILHVVYNCDAFIRRKNSELIPSFEIRNCFDNELLFRYEAFIKSLSWVPCQNMIGTIDQEYMNIWMERLVIERLERKSLEIKNLLGINNGDWEQTFYQLLARNFGFRINSYPFELLAKSIPIKVLAKHSDDLIQIEALLFGQAGFLNTSFKDEYPKELKAEYNYLQKKCSLQAGDRFLWKFLRLRPSNFPTLRIAQLSKLIHRSPSLFTSVMECTDVSSVFKLFDVTSSLYWDSHYRFDKKSSEKQKKLGVEAIRLFVINTIAPAMFCYGWINDLEIFQQRSLEFLHDIRAENNAIVRRWKKYGVRCDSASHTQALLELKSNYCDDKKCLLCRVGNFLIRS